MDLFMEIRNPGRSITLIKKKSRSSKISHKDEKQELTKETEKEQSEAGGKAENHFAIASRKRVFKKRSLYVGKHIGSQGFKTFAC